MIDIDQNSGAFNWGNYYDPQNAPGTSSPPTNSSKIWYAIEKDMTSSGEFLGVSGSETNRLSPSNKELNVAYFNTTSTTSTWDKVEPITNIAQAVSYDLCFDANHNLLVPGIYNCNNCIYAGENFGEASVFRINYISGNVITYYPITDGTIPGLVNAYDLKVGITNTSDGGFAVVTSKVPYTFTSMFGPFSWTCDGFNYTPYKYWNADAFVRKFDASGTEEWSKTWDIDDHAPVPFPGDQKRQECMYSISETPDHGLVVSGNNSRNFDDSYLVKLYDNCVNNQKFDFSKEAEDGILELSEIGTTLVGNYNIKGSIVIHNGESLTIYGSGTQIHFADTRKCGIPTNIVVEPGGSLVVADRALLTSITDCEMSMWDGIQLWGENEHEQITSPQPVVKVITNATIENARYGIIADKAAYAEHEHWITSNQCMIKDLVLEETQAYGGGLVECNEANFHNDRFGVVFDAYEHNNHSFITNSIFNLDNYLNDFDAVNGAGHRIGINAHVKMYDVGRISLTDNQFHIDYSVSLDELDRGTGIGSFESQFLATGNEFKNLYRGIDAGSVNTLKNFYASCNTFTDNVRSLRANQIDFADIRNNTFFVGTGTYPYGIYLEECNGYNLEGNALQNGYSNTSPVSGIIDNFFSENENANMIYRNSLDYFHFSLALAGYQNKDSAHAEGLEASCNDLTNYDYGIFVAPAALPGTSGIAGIQDGISGNGANNFFMSTGCTTSAGEIYNPTGQNPITTYKHKLNDVTNNWYVEPFSTCYTASGQFSPNLITVQVNKALDCPNNSPDCEPAYEAYGEYRVRAQNQIQTDLLINEKIRNILNMDTTGSAADSIINFCIQSGLPDKEYLLVSAYQLAGRTAEMNSELQILASDPVYATFTSMMRLRDTLRWEPLAADSGIFRILTRLSIDSSSYGYNAARTMLTNVYGTSFDDVILLPVPDSLPRLRHNSVMKDFTVYPNPFSSEFYVDLTGMNGPIELNLYNSVGEHVQKILSKENQVVTIHTENLPVGLYLLTGIVNGETRFTSKISKLN